MSFLMKRSMRWQGDFCVLEAAGLNLNFKSLGLGENSNSVINPKFGKIIAEAWRDPAFKLALIANSAIAV
jgi:hypothetical protein